MWLATVVSWVFVLFGLIWLMLETWIWKHRSRIRHAITGEPIPSASFFELIISIFKNCCGMPTDPMRNPLRNRKRLGDTFLIWRGWTPVVMTAGFEDAKNLLSEKGDFFKPDLLGNNPNMNRIFGKSLVAVSGDTWKQQRKTLDPAFKYKKLKTLVPLFAQAAEKLLSYWDKICDQGPITVEEGITSMTLDVIGLAGFSYSFGALDKAEDGTSKADSALENYETIMGSLFSPLNIFFPSLGKLRRDYNIKLDKAHTNMDKLLFSIIDQHRQTSDKEEDEGDLLDHILALDQSGQLTNREIRDNLFLFFVAGHDTSSSVLTSALYYLSLYPRIQEKAYEEVISVVGEGQITYNHLPKLELISNIIKETCRMRPPVGGTSARKAAHDGVTIGEYVLPEGQLVMPSIFGVNYNEKQWKSPNTFNPDRFKGKSTATDAAILSFSLGPHVCIGKKFAIIEMTVALSMIVRKFRFQQLPGYEWRYKPFSLTLKPLDSLPLIVKRR